MESNFTTYTTAEMGEKNSCFARYVKSVCTTAVVFCCLIFSDSSVSILDNQNIGINENTIIVDINSGDSITDFNLQGKSIVTPYDNTENKFYWNGGAITTTDVIESMVSIDGIARLDDNWNGNYASKFGENLLMFVREIVMRLEIQPIIYPTARDSVQFEYENIYGDYLEFEIFDDKVIKMFLLLNDGTIKKSVISREVINKEVKQFYGRKVC